MKRCLMLMVCLMLLCGSAAAEGGYALPMDLTPGMPLDPARYADDFTYEDLTIALHVTTGDKDGTPWWMAEVTIAHPSQLRTMPAASFTSKMTMQGKRLSARANAVLAVDGDYFSIEVGKKGSYVLRQGTLYSQHLIGKSDVLLIDEAGDFHMLHKPQEGDVPDTVDGRSIVNALCFGPVLVEDGVVSTIESNDFMATDKLRARVALCQLDTLHYAVVCCNGPSAGSKGLILQDFADLLGTLGVQQAYNLDGGNSAMMFTGDKMINTNRSLREISDLVYFASAWPGEGSN